MANVHPIQLPDFSSVIRSSFREILPAVQSLVAVEQWLDAGHSVAWLWVLDPTYGRSFWDQWMLDGGAREPGWDRLWPRLLENPVSGLYVRQIFFKLLGPVLAAPRSCWDPLLQCLGAEAARSDWEAYLESKASIHQLGDGPDVLRALGTLTLVQSASREFALPVVFEALECLVNCGWISPAWGLSPKVPGPTPDLWTELLVQPLEAVRADLERYGTYVATRLPSLDLIEQYIALGRRNGWESPNRACLEHACNEMIAVTPATILGKFEQIKNDYLEQLLSGLGAWELEQALPAGLPRAPLVRF